MDKLFTVARNDPDRNSYWHLAVELVDQSINRPVQFTWQGGTGQDQFDGWYGFHCLVDVRNAYQFDEASKVVKKALKDLEPNPFAMIGRLLSLGFHQALYDGRTSKWTALSEIPDPDLKGWRDDWKFMGRSSCMVSGLAKDETEARKVIAQELFQDGYLDYLNEWDKAGRPVKMVDTFTPPKLSLAEMLFSEWYQDKETK
jgi:hypothetical protein